MRAFNEKLIIGSYANCESPGVYLGSFNNSSGDVEITQHVSGNENPSYLAIAKNGQWVYVVNELKNSEEGILSVYSLSNTSGLQITNTISYKGGASCYISVDRELQHAFIANYEGYSVTVISLQNGVSENVVQTLRFNGMGRDPERQNSPHLHAAVLDANEKYLYCTDLGTDRIYVYQYNANSQQPLVLSGAHYLRLPPVSGPRHLVCSKNAKWLYVLCELSGALFFIAQSGVLTGFNQELNLCEEGFQGKIEAADIQISATDEYLYASSRGDANQIVVFKIDQNNGSLTKIQSVSAEGKGPRSLAINPTGNFLLAANELSNSITIFAISPNNGKLTFTGKTIQISKPTCIKFIH